MSRISAFLFLLLLGACQQNPTDNAESSAPSPEKENVAKHSVITDLAQPIRNELQTTMESMDAINQQSIALHMGINQENRSSNAEIIDAIFEKSSFALGALFVLKGSLSAVEERFNQGILDKKQAQEMLRKLDLDLTSHQSDLKEYQKALESIPSKDKKAESGNAQAESEK